MEIKEQKTALLIMDVQQAIVPMLENRDEFYKNINRAITNSRENNIQVIFGTVGFRKSYPEVSDKNKIFSAMKNSERSMDSEQATSIPNEVHKLDDDITFTKRRISSFTGSDLEVILRSLGIDHLVLTGIATSGVVLSTLREAADKDYKITVLSDCCADRDEEVHSVLLNKVFPRQAKVLTCEEYFNKK